MSEIKNWKWISVLSICAIIGFKNYNANKKKIKPEINPIYKPSITPNYTPITIPTNSPKSIAPKTPGLSVTTKNLNYKTYTPSKSITIPMPDNDPPKFSKPFPSNAPIDLVEPINPDFHK